MEMDSIRCHGLIPSLREPPKPPNGNLNSGGKTHIGRWYISHSGFIPKHLPTWDLCGYVPSTNLGI